uniref:response regulator transcription factor n=1 Tax=Agathobacter sp. TaxID=2021311 RepID=UPI004055A76E
MEKYCRIIIIDDEFIMRQGIKYMLDWEKEGFQFVGEAKDGKEGLRLIEEIRPDIVLLDVVIPVLNGIEISTIMREQYPEIQFIVLSGHDDFEYVKATLLNGAVDYILKPTINPNELLQALHKAAKRIPGMQLRKSNQLSIQMQLEKCLLGYQEELSGIEMEKEFPYSQFRIAGINLKQMCEDKKEKMVYIEGLIKEYLAEDGIYKAVSVLIKKDILCYVFNYRVKEEATLLKKLEFCMQKISAIKPQALAVVSESFTNVQNIKRCYQTEIVPLINRKFYYANQSLLFVDHGIKQEKESRFAYENYTNYLVHGQLNLALSMFKEYIQSMCEIRMDEYRLKNLTKNLLYNFLIEAERYGVQGDAIRDEYFEEIDRTCSVESFLQVLGRLFEKLERFENTDDTQNGEKIRKMRAYIAENYDENLTLASLADRFGFSYHYLSYYFNKQAKEGFSEYLNKIRIKKACELLRGNEYSISEISRMIGYSDHAYFCRVFKKITGQTPSYYRRIQKCGDIE